MVLSYQGVKDKKPPIEYTEYMLLQKLNMSLLELYSLPESKVKMFIHLMNLEQQYSSRGQNK